MLTSQSYLVAEENCGRSRLTTDSSFRIGILRPEMHHGRPIGNPLVIFLSVRSDRFSV
jgi:hypothetical protein